MRKYRKYFLVCFFMFLPVLTFAKVTCSNGDYSATIDIDKNLMSMEDTSKITIESTYTYEVTYNPNNDIVSISTDGIITPNKVGNAKINTIIKFFNESEEVAECNSNIDISVLSSDSTLKSLTIEELDISSLFKSDLYEYVVTLPYNYEKVNIIAIPNDEKAEISGDGRRYLNEGINEFNIIVKAKDKKNTVEKMEEKGTEIIKKFSEEEINFYKNTISRKIKEHWQYLTNNEKREFLTNFVEEIIIVNKSRDKKNGKSNIINVKFYDAN